MLNIPTDVLRTLLAVVDMRSFTKAAQLMGVTQPTVSAQIKRLRFLLAFDVLDKSAPGVSLTPRGEIVVNNARRLRDQEQPCHLGGPLSNLPELYCAVVVREGVDRIAIAELADYLEDQIRAEPNSLGFVGAPQGA
jgi:hypothetical protein